ncbi:GntR family transcriptional regulator [Microbulbifer rhizosphaerae]|uniref:GntR family transcriptional regulator n=1 Tax=Microbulbifer rhizosphaerae TaxID=1562603 RepID=A0A7W4W8C6_9GAMM|nr:GntR family transcriptional regulator [Microbulbifer rhizosphaerae]MBB3059536.1 GntR family transcriptional regulator [Microbulbifer rhizosphaerae]
MIQISTGDSRPIFRQIVDSIRLQIATGELEPGTKLPSVRGLAMQLTVNTNTVAKAYNELTAQGWLESRPGLGLFVSKPRKLFSDRERERRLNEAVQQFINQVIGLDYDPDELLQRLERDLRALDIRSARSAGNE